VRCRARSPDAAWLWREARRATLPNDFVRHPRVRAVCASPSSNDSLSRALASPNRSEFSSGTPSHISDPLGQRSKSGPS
jgi:hypothetical protein